MGVTLKRLIYTSQATGTADEALMEDILATARSENPKHDITGMLLFGDGTFIQVLEGPTKALDRLVENIRRDARHDGFDVIYEDMVEDRAFSDWSMAYRVLTPERIEQFGGQLAAHDQHDLISFLRNDDHFVKRFLAECVKDIASAA